MNVVLVHEWLTNLAGSEKVVEALRRAFPDAPVCTTMRWGSPFDEWDDVRTTWLQRLARGPSSHVRATPLMPAAWRTTKLPPADVYITSFHSFALHARVPRDAPHVVYCHTPPRFIWAREQLRGDGGRAMALAMDVAARMLAPGDRSRAASPTAWVANSTAVAARIRRVYERDATVVHPPVDVERFASAIGTPKEDHFLYFGRLVPYKRPEVAIAAFADLGWPLVVAGDGRARAALEAMAPPNVRFIGRPDDADLPALLAGARALVFPGEEDFGISPVEAMAAGTPVVALGRGGALDTVEDGVTGVLVDAEGAPSLADGVRRAASREWDAAAVSAAASRFGVGRFVDQMTALSLSVAGTG